MVKSLMMLNICKCNVLKITRTENPYLWVFQSVEHQIIFPSEPSASKFPAPIHLISPFISEMKSTCIEINQTHTELCDYVCVVLCKDIIPSPQDEL